MLSALVARLDQELAALSQFRAWTDYHRQSTPHSPMLCSTTRQDVARRQCQFILALHAAGDHTMCRDERFPLDLQAAQCTQRVGLLCRQGQHLFCADMPPPFVCALRKNPQSTAAKPPTAAVPPPVPAPVTTKQPQQPSQQALSRVDPSTML